MRDLLNDYFDKVKNFSEESEILKKFIISLAVQGKLINKKSNSDSAKNLLNEIKKEKEFLIQKGEKILLSAFDQKLLIPFKIPANWEWSSLGEICSYIQRGKSPKYALEGTKVISQKCIQWSGLDLSVAKFIENKSLVKYKKEQFLKVGDLLWNSTGTGTIGRVLKVNNLEEELVCDSHVTILRCLKVNPDFVKIWLMSDYVYGLIEEKAAGSTNQIELTKKIAIEQCIPIPPLIEQNIIVEKVEELTRLCNQLEKDQINCIETHNTLVENLLNVITSTQTDTTKFAETWQIIQTNFDILFTTERSVEQLKKAILQLAIMGRLVPQDLDDEPASILLDKIKLEKANLIKFKKIRKTTLPNFLSNKEDLFNLPIGWEWAPLGIIGNIFNGNSISKDIKERKYTNIIGRPYLSTKDIAYGFESPEYNTGVAIPIDEPNFKIASKNSVLICSEGGSAGKKCGITDREICFGNKLYANKLHGNINPRFILSFYLTPLFYNQFCQFMTGIIGGVSVSKFSQIQCPVPPLAEQSRIIAKIDELLDICEKLKENISKKQNIQNRLAYSLMEQDFR